MSNRKPKQNDTPKFPVFGDRLNEIYKESGKKIVAFAKDVGLTRQSMGYYLNRDRIPDIETLCEICKKCNVSADWLLGLSDVKKPDTELRACSEYSKLSEKALNKLRSMPESVISTIEKTIIESDVFIYINDFLNADLSKIYEYKEKENMMIPIENKWIYYRMEQGNYLAMLPEDYRFTLIKRITRAIEKLEDKVNPERRKQDGKINFIGEIGELSNNEQE